MYFELLLGISILILFLLTLGAWIPPYGRWLKGSQKNYTLQSYGNVAVTEGKLRREAGEVISWSVPTIEIRRGPFRGSSRICGMGDRVHDWSIARSWRDRHGIDWVQLEQTRRGLTARDAVELVRRYSSLRNMFDDLKHNEIDLRSIRGLNEEFRENKVQMSERISVLESDLNRTEQKAKDNKREAQFYVSAIRAVMTRLPDKQRGKSPLIAAVKRDLENVWMTVDTGPIPEEVDRWISFLEDRIVR